MAKRTVSMKPKAAEALRKQGLNDAAIEDMAKMLDEGRENAAKKIGQLGAQIEKIKKERAYWQEKFNGYDGALDKIADVTIEEEEPVDDPVNDAETVDAADVGEIKLK